MLPHILSVATAFLLQPVTPSAPLSPPWEAACSVLVPSGWLCTGRSPRKDSAHPEFMPLTKNLVFLLQRAGPASHLPLPTTGLNDVHRLQHSCGFYSLNHFSAQPYFIAFPSFPPSFLRKCCIFSLFSIFWMQSQTSYYCICKSDLWVI